MFSFYRWVSFFSFFFFCAIEQLTIKFTFLKIKFYMQILSLFFLFICLGRCILHTQKKKICTRLLIDIRKMCRQ